MGPNEEIKKRVLKDLPEAYNREGMSGLGKWVDTFNGEEKDYAQRVMNYLEEINKNPSARIWGILEERLEEILKEVD